MTHILPNLCIKLGALGQGCPKLNKKIIEMFFICFFYPKRKQIHKTCNDP